MAAKNKPDDSPTWDRAKDVLTILVIPLLLWGVRQEIRLAQIESLVEDQATLREDLHDLEVKVASMSRPLQANSQSIDELHTRLEHLTDMVESIDDQIKKLD